MAKKLTIQVSDEFYDGLQRRVGKRGIGRFLEDLARPHVLTPKPGDPGWEDWLERQYAEAAADEEAEREAEGVGRGRPRGRRVTRGGLESGCAMRRGEVWWAALDPVRGGEIGKTRPAVIISNDVANAAAQPRPGRADDIERSNRCSPGRRASNSEAASARCWLTRSARLRRSGCRPESGCSRPPTCGTWSARCGSSSRFAEGQNPAQAGINHPGSHRSLRPLTGRAYGHAPCGVLWIASYFRMRRRGRRSGDACAPLHTNSTQRVSQEDSHAAVQSESLRLGRHRRPDAGRGRPGPARLHARRVQQHGPGARDLGARRARGQQARGRERAGAAPPAGSARST